MLPLVLLVSGLRMPAISSISRRAACAAAAAAAISGAPFRAAADVPAADEVKRVFDGVPWEDTPPFTREDFRRLDESSDDVFYTEPRLVYHVDDAAVAATREYYTTLFEQMRAKRGGAPLEVLDLCSSWVSHFPASQPGGLQYRAAGLGMNGDELKANKQLSQWVVADLNQRKDRKVELPYADNAFDLITCTVSIDYLTRPLDVAREVARVLRPGGTVAIVFSNRLFFSKAVAVWTGKDDLEHVYTVGSYLHYGAGDSLTPPQAADLTPRRKGKATGDPLYVVYASKVGAPPAAPAGA